MGLRMTWPGSLFIDFSEKVVSKNQNQNSLIISSFPHFRKFQLPRNVQKWQKKIGKKKTHFHCQSLVFSIGSYLWLLFGCFSFFSSINSFAIPFVFSHLSQSLISFLFIDFSLWQMCQKVKIITSQVRKKVN